MFSKQFIISLVFSSMFALSLIVVYHYNFASEKIGYVRTGFVINSFNGTKIAEKRFKSELSMVQGNSDTLDKRVRILKNDIQFKKKSMQEWAYKVGKAEAELLQYQRNADDQMRLRQQELSKGTIESINSFINDYGKKKGYKLILGSTEDGSILFGKVNDDITDEIVKGLNAKFPIESLQK